jgi:hypothetical protein
MDIDRSGLAENDYTRGLSQELERLLQEKNVLEELKQKVEGIGMCLFDSELKLINCHFYFAWSPIFRR